MLCAFFFYMHALLLSTAPEKKKSNRWSRSVVEPSDHVLNLFFSHSIVYTYIRNSAVSMVFLVLPFFRGVRALSAALPTTHKNPIHTRASSFSHSISSSVRVCVCRFRNFSQFERTHTNTYTHILLSSCSKWFRCVLNIHRKNEILPDCKVLFFINVKFAI